MKESEARKNHYRCLVCGEALGVTRDVYYCLRCLKEAAVTGLRRALSKGDGE